LEAFTFICYIYPMILEMRSANHPKPKSKGFSFYEFFAGGGMARAGLGEGWQCAFANDFDPNKVAVYRDNWGDDKLVQEDVNFIATTALSGEVDLAWASFPCQDLSLAGNYAGLGLPSSKAQTRSGSFWPFWRLMQALVDERRSPRVIVLENVYGALTSNEGRDFTSICSVLSEAGYRFGAMVIDARLFLPHSRQRLFIVAVRGDLRIAPELHVRFPISAWHPPALLLAYGKLLAEMKKQWLWWNLPVPPRHSMRFADLIEEKPTGVEWHTKAETERLIKMMSSLNLAKLNAAKHSGRREVGGVYKRTRVVKGVKLQRAEVRFDDLAGCLRTPSGGSSRQTIIVVDGNNVRSRLLSPREATRLMGLPDSYKLPIRYNDGYHLAGDGVAVPVVRYLAQNLIEPVLTGHPRIN
jgi:DNA (cytosine-5)-methyltransferase 1